MKFGKNLPLVTFGSERVNIYGHPVNTDTFYAPLSVRIIGVSPYSCHTQFLLPPALPGATWGEGL